MLRTFWLRLLDVVLRRSREERLSQEIQAHLDLLTDEHIAAGMLPDDARLAARRTFGSVDQLKMRHRDQRGLPVIETLVQDVRFATRLLARERGFALTAIIVLAVGIGVNNMFFTLVYAHKFRGLPIAHPERVLSISTIDDRAADRAVSPPDFEDLKAGQRSFDGLAAYVNGVATVGDENRSPDRFDAAYVSSNAFALLEIPPVVGRLPSPDEDRPGAAPVVFLGVTAWQSRYGGDRSILGRSILVNGAAATVAGLIPDRSGFPSDATVWLPLGQLPGLAAQKRDSRTFRVFGRLRAGVLPSDARAEIEAIFNDLDASHPDTNKNLRARVMPINERLLGNLDGWMPFIVVGLIVLLVAGANAANLMMARAIHRAPEIAIRTSLGASRVRIARQLLIEALVLAAAGGAAGAALSLGGVQVFKSAIPDGILSYWFDYSMDTRVFAALVTVSFATAFVFGMVPALQASRTDVNHTLKDGGRTATGNRGTRAWTAAFLTAELALATVLMAQFAIGNLSSRSPIPTDGALETTSVVTSAITLPTAAYREPNRRTEFFEQLRQRLLAHPEIASVSRTTFLPLSGASNRRLELRAAARAEGQDRPTVRVIEIAPDYFKTLDLSPSEGREFQATDGEPGQANAIVNDRFGQVFLAGKPAIGAQIAVTPADAQSGVPPAWLTIIGVAPSIRDAPRATVNPVVYLPIRGSEPSTVTVMVRHRTDPSAVANILRGDVLSIDSNVPLYRMQTLGSAVHDAQWNPRVANYLALTVTSMSVLLAMVGLYAVTAQSVTRRTREIGLRVALGARSAQIGREILRSVRIPLGLGLLLGVAGALAWDRAFSSGLVNTYAANPRLLLVFSVLLAALVGIACFIPVRKAIRLNPLTALRHE